MRRRIKQIIMEILFLLLSEKVYIKTIYKIIMGHKLNLKNPKKFSEKIQFRKIYGNNEFYSIIADKFLVRNYIKEKIGDKYLIPLYGVYEKIEKNNLEKIEVPFILKTNNGSGGHYIIKNNEEKNNKNMYLKLNKEVNKFYGKLHLEKFYNYIKPKIIVEKLILEANKLPSDIKIHCFNNKDNNKTKFLIQIIKNRDTNMEMSYYDEEWNLLDIISNNKLLKEEKPDQLNEMLEIARKLSEDFDYLRVDLYNVEKKIYFGELTQTPRGGFFNYFNEKIDLKIGEMWKIDYSNVNLYVKENPLNNKNRL